MPSIPGNPLPIRLFRNQAAWEAWQEQRYFLVYPGGVPLVPEVQENYRYGAPPSTPVLALGHTGLGVFVGDINHEAPYTPGSDG